MGSFFYDLFVKIKFTHNSYLETCKNIIKALKELNEGKYNFELINVEQTIEENEFYTIKSKLLLGVKNATKEKNEEKLEFDEDKCVNQKGFLERISNFIKKINEIKNKLENTTIIKELDSFINVVGKNIHKGTLKMIIDSKENSITFSFEKNTKNDYNEVYEILEIKIIFKKKFILYIQKLSDCIAQKKDLINIDIFCYFLLLLSIFILVNKKMMNYLLQNINEIANEDSSMLNEIQKGLYLTSNYN